MNFSCYVGPVFVCVMLHFRSNYTVNRSAQSDSFPATLLHGDVQDAKCCFCFQKLREGKTFEV